MFAEEEDTSCGFSGGAARNLQLGLHAVRDGPSLLRPKDNVFACHKIVLRTAGVGICEKKGITVRRRVALGSLCPT